MLLGVMSDWGHTRTSHAPSPNVRFFWGKRTTDVRFFSYAQIPIAHPTGIIAQASLLTPWCSALI